MESTIPIRSRATISMPAEDAAAHKGSGLLKKLGEMLVKTNSANPSAIRCAQMDKMMNRSVKKK